MELKNINRNIIVRVFLLAISIFFAAYLFFESKQIVRGLYALLIPLGITIELIFYLNQNNRNIRNYLEAIKWDDFSIKMPVNMKNKSFRDLNTSLNRFNEKLENLRKDNFTQYYFIEALIHEALVGLIVIDYDDKIFFVNKSFKDIVGKPNIQLYKNVNHEIESVWKEISDLDLNDKKSVEISSIGQKKIILFQVSKFIIDGQNYRLFSAQNIKSEVENTEIEAWKKLIRVLSHEILNSASPILSLSDTLSDIINDETYDQDIILQKLKEGLDVINQRSSGLIKFTNAFNTISKLPKPEKHFIQLEEIITKLQVLFETQFINQNIKFEYNLTSGAEKIFADQYQIEQVLINLVKNAIESFTSTQTEKAIQVISNKNTDNIIIEIKDNGAGINTKDMTKIFLPFFTTKENGNGIGLALSKQILNHHKGDISIESHLSKGTKVILSVPIN